MTMTYGSLVGSKTTPGSIQAWVNYARLDADTVLAEAQATIFQRLRVREMRTLDASITVAPGGFQYPLPASFLEARAARTVLDDLAYELRSPADVVARRRFDASGTLVAGPPLYYAIFDEMLQFEASFTTASPFLLLCFKSPTPLSSQNPSNFLTGRFPHLVRTACLAQAADFLRNDADYAKQMQKLELLIEATNAESDLGMGAATFSTTVS